MTSVRNLLCLILGCVAVVAWGQKKAVPMDLYSLTESHKLKPAGSEIAPFSEQGKKGVRFSEKEKDGVAWIDGLTFSNGTIELDIKGRDALQKSFVGVAFHGADDQTMDVIYFRPFNFQSTDPVRKIHAVQYVSSPDFGWQRLREEQNGKYEKGIEPPPSANEWFHARIVVHSPKIDVYVNGNSKPSLTVDKLNTRQKGKIGLWVGPFSNGDFANLTITEE